jgi:hypothetical protein
MILLGDKKAVNLSDLHFFKFTQIFDLEFFIFIYLEWQTSEMFNRIKVKIFGY